MRVVAGVSVLFALAVAGPSAPGARPPSVQQVALAEIAKAATSGRIDPATAAEGRTAVNHASALLRRLPAARRPALAGSLAQVAGLGKKLTEPRARATFGQLRATSGYLATHRPPAPETDITDDDGIVYRWF